MRAVRVLIATALGVVLAATLPGVAHAGQFVIASCQADQNHYSTAAFNGSFVTRGMEIKPQCSPEGKGLRGLVTQNHVGKGTVPVGAVARVSIAAPPGTSFTTFRWAGTARRTDCRYALQLWAEGPRIKVPIKNVRANHRCPRPLRAQAAGYRSRAFDVTGATRIVQRVICMGAPRRRVCSARGRNYIRTFTAKVWVVDNTPPSASIVRNTPLAAGAWVGGTQPLNYVAQDNVGVRQGSAIGARGAAGADFRTCALATPSAFADGTPCPNGPGQIMVATRQLPEGTQPLFVRVQDPAGNAGDSAAVTVRVDNTPPPRVDVDVEGGYQWRNTNAFRLVWTNPTEGDRAPIAAALYKLCPTGASSCTSGIQGRGAIADLPITVPHPGAWTAAVWRQDAAGNADPAVASVPVTLRYDPEPPHIAFEPPSANDPTLVSAQVTETVSDIAGGAIEISRVGSNTWHTLNTQRQRGRLLARIDDASLPAGQYLVRATTADLAHNQASTTQREDGQPMTLTLPLRVTSTMQVGVVRQRVVRRTVRRHGKRRTIRRRVPILKHTAVVRLGRRVQIKGRLLNRNGDGIAGADVQVFSSSAVAPQQLVAVVRTNAAGAYSYTAAGSTSRTLRFAYGGSLLVLPSEGQVGLIVPATSSLHVSRRRVLNGQHVVFRGRVKSLPLPPGGKLLQLEVRLPGRWQTFRTARTDAQGRWRVPYRFTRTRGVQHYRFRVELPPEAGYPFARGTSKSVSVRVRGQ